MMDNRFNQLNAGPHTRTLHQRFSYAQFQPGACQGRARGHSDGTRAGVAPALFYGGSHANVSILHCARILAARQRRRLLLSSASAAKAALAGRAHRSLPAELQLTSARGRAGRPGQGRRPSSKCCLPVQIGLASILHPPAGINIPLGRCLLPLLASKGRNGGRGALPFTRPAGSPPCPRNPCSVGPGAHRPGPNLR